MLHLLQNKETVLAPLIVALEEAGRRIVRCGRCGNLDVTDPCALCADPRRDHGVLCVVEQVADLWALERTRAFRGLYHVLGGTLSALDGIGPEDLAIAPLVARAGDGTVREVILALGATLDGQTTAHYVAERLRHCSVAVSRLAQGVPAGGELGFLDAATLTAALTQRQPLG